MRVHRHADATDRRSPDLAYTSWPLWSYAHSDVTHSTNKTKVMNRDPAVIDVQAEIAHWQARDAQDRHGIGKLSELSPVVKIACDIYLQSPRSSEPERLRLFWQRIEQHFASASAQERYEQLASECWRRLSQGAA